MISSPSQRPGRCSYASLVTLLIGIAAVLTGVAAPAARGQEAEAYFVPETRQVIAEPFLSAWMAVGGPDRLGMPVSSIDAADGRSTQYFERGALRLGRDETVDTVAVGQDLLDRPDPSAPLRSGRRSPSPRETRPFTALPGAPASASVVYDADTGHSVKGSMLSAYEADGGADELGSPLSEAYRTGDARVQWFEMRRLEDRGDDMAMAPVGTELALLDGADLTPRRQGSFATFDLPAILAARDGDVAVGDDRSTAGLSFAPSRIQIPAIGVDASIETIGIVDGAMQVPSDPWNVGWYSGLGGPGGNTVMAAHKDWYGIGPVVFWSLGALGAGNEIFLYDGAGNAATYVVYESFAVDAYTDSGSIIGDQGGDTLTLITCGGDFDGSMYNLRVIVRASRAA